MIVTSGIRLVCGVFLRQGDEMHSPLMSKCCLSICYTQRFCSRCTLLESAAQTFTTGSMAESGTLCSKSQWFWGTKRQDGW